jgi:dethiobiotin synthetase
MSRGLFITGTGTGVGKTYVAALIAKALVAKGLKVGVYKPAASGCELRSGQLVSPDAIDLWEAAGRPGSLEQACPQMFSAPLAPHLAAREEGRRIDAKLLRGGLEYWRSNNDIVLVEGAGGLMSPISDGDYNTDLANDFGFPLVIVSANELGTINSTMQTLITANAYCDDVPIAGLVLNSPRLSVDDPSTASNRDELVRRCKVPLLAEVAHGGGFDQEVDWWKLAGG